MQMPQEISSSKWEKTLKCLWSFHINLFLVQMINFCPMGILNRAGISIVDKKINPRFQTLNMITFSSKKQYLERDALGIG